METTLGTGDLWTAGGVLLGFQVNAFAWRIAREVEVAKKSDIVWFTPADYLNLVAMIVTVAGVFIAPALGLLGPYGVRVLFGCAALLFMGHVLGVAAHYQLLFSSGTQRRAVWCPLQEKVVIVVITVATMAYLLGAILMRGA